VKRKIIKINEELCNGCGLCIPNCPEGAMQVIDGKVRLMSDLFCDGLGACVGHCPVAALTVEEREAEVYDEKRVMANIVKQGANTIKAHLSHLYDHGETGYYNEAISYLSEAGYKTEEFEVAKPVTHSEHHGCPGARMMDLSGRTSKKSDESADSIKRESELSTWPVQLKLANPRAPYFQGKDVLFAADCVAYALADFHKDYLKGKSLIIACPKLDDGAEIYVEKITTLIEQSDIASLSVMIMEVPCCSGIVHMVGEAMKKSSRKISFQVTKVSLRGEVLSRETVEV
jgi:ferredoxin